MITFILLTHIFIASLLTIATGIVSFATYRQKETSAYPFMLGTFVATIVSGAGLLLVGAGSIGRVCATMSAVTVVVLIARYYYRVRVIAQTV